MQAICNQTANCGLQVGNKRDHPIPYKGNLVNLNVMLDNALQDVMYET